MYSLIEVFISLFLLLSLSLKNASSRTEKRKKGGPLNYNPLVSGDDVTLKIMKKHKEVWIIVTLVVIHYV